MYDNITVGINITVESVIVRIYSAVCFNQLDITITSPLGTQSILSTTVCISYKSSKRVLIINYQSSSTNCVNTTDIPLQTYRSWGENGIGPWQLYAFTDYPVMDRSVIDYWHIDIYGGGKIEQLNNFKYSTVYIFC